MMVWNWKYLWGIIKTHAGGLICLTGINLDHLIVKSFQQMIAFVINETNGIGTVNETKPSSLKYQSSRKIQIYFLFR